MNKLSRVFILTLAVLFIFTSCVFAQVGDLEFDDAMKFGVFPRRPHFDAFWNPSKVALLSRDRQAGLFSVTFPYNGFDISMKGLGAGFTHGKNTFMYFTDHLEISLEDSMFRYELDEKEYRFGFARALNRHVMLGAAYKKIIGDEMFDWTAFGGPGAFQITSTRGDGIDLGATIKFSPVFQLEYLFLDASTSVKIDDKEEKLPSTQVVQVDIFPLKGLTLSSQLAHYQDDTLDDQDDFRSGIGYTHNKLFSARFVAGEAGRFSLYGASLHLKALSLNYDVWKHELVEDDSQSFLSVIMRF